MLSLRRMTPDDLDKVVMIENSAFDNPWSLASFVNILRYDCFVLLHHVQIAGYICCIRVLDECSISNIAIARDHQGKGYGKWLMLQTINYMIEHGINAFYLEARRSNESAIKLYEKIGFRPLSIRKNYYINPQEDAIVMAYAANPDNFRKTTWKTVEEL